MEEADRFRADLHCHSTCSDGSEMPEQLIKLAVERGLSGLAITDHDNCESYVTALPAAKEHGVKLLSGIELSAVHAGVSVHILGYSFAFGDPNIQVLADKHRVRRFERNGAILALLAKHGMKFTSEELAGMAQGTIGRPHIAALLVQKGYVPDIKSAFKRYIGEGCSCYVKGENFSPEETIDVIHRAKGFAVIAHPHLIERKKVVDALLGMNFDGIECHYSLFQPTENQRWLDVAQRKNWLVTGGSDFHGSVKPNIKLGCAWVGKEYFLPLQARFEANST